MLETFLESYKLDVLRALDSIDMTVLQRVIGTLTEARDTGRHIFVCGNGGSASTASHFACDMIKGASYSSDQPRFRITALTDSLPTITAYSNDVGYSSIFAEQLKNLADPGDVVIAISGSGNSPNVIEAMAYANSIDCRTVALTGRDGGILGPMAEMNIHVGNGHMGRIEDVHLIVTHMIAYHFMEAMQAEPVRRARVAVARAV